MCPSRLVVWLQCQALPQQAPGELVRCQEVTHRQRQGWNHSWAPRARQLRTQGWKLSPFGYVWIYASRADFVNLTPEGQPKGQWVLPGTDLALAAVGFVGVCTRGLAGPASELPPWLPQKIQVHNFCDFWGLTSVDLCCGLVKTVSERHLGPLPAFPWLRQGQGQCQGCILWMHTMGERWLNEHTYPWTASVERYPVAPLLVGALQPCLPHTSAQKHSSETDRGFLLKQWRSQFLPLTEQWQPRSNDGALLNIQPGFWSPQDQSHLLSRG